MIWSPIKKLAMMNQQPDKFFREKLQGLQKPAPSSAWSKVETQLDKKKHKGIFLKIAAAIIFLAATSILLWINNTTEKPALLTEIKKEEISNPISRGKNIAPLLKLKDSIKSVQPDKIDNNANVLVQKARKTKRSIKKIIPKKSDRKGAFTYNNAIATIEIEKPIQPVADIEEQLPTIAPVTSGNHDTGITLVYTAKEIDEKYLDKKSLAEATSKDKKPSTLRKLLDKAYDLKHNQDAFGDLRQKKNEILALNFKNEKQRSQNR